MFDDDALDDHYTKLAYSRTGTQLTSLFAPSLQLVDNAAFTAVSTITSASESFSSNRLYLVSVGYTTLGSTLSAITGGGIIFDLVRRETQGTVRCEVWRGMGKTSEGITDGVMTFTFSGAVIQGRWSLTEGIGFIADDTNGKTAVAWAGSTSTASGTSLTIAKTHMADTAPGPWIVPETDEPIFADAYPDGTTSPEFFSDIMGLRGDTVDARIGTGAAQTGSAVDEPFGSAGFLNPHNVIFATFAVNNTESQSTKVSSTWGLLDNNASSASSVLTEWKLGEDLSPSESSASAAIRAGVALELRWDGVTSLAPPTKHVYLIKHIKIINWGTSTGNITIFRGTTSSATKMVFQSTMLAGSRAEFTGMWIVNAGDDLQVESASGTDATVILYGLDLTT